MFSRSSIGILLGAANLGCAHFTLQYPTPIGQYSDVNLAIGPCDGYDPTTATVFQNWPWRGEALAMFTTHPNVIWNFNVALFSEVKNDQSAFIPLAEDSKQNNGTGALCLGQVPGKKEWVGQKAIVQMIQNAPDGKLYTCIAVTFTDDAADSGGSACYNISGPAMLPYDISWLAGTGSDLNPTTPSSSTTTSTSFTSTSSSESATIPSSTTQKSSSSTLSSSTGTKSSGSSTIESQTGTGSVTSASKTSSASGTLTSKASIATVSGTLGSNSTKSTGTTSSGLAQVTGAAVRMNAEATVFTPVLALVALMALGL